MFYSVCLSKADMNDITQTNCLNIQGFNEEYQLWRVNVNIIWKFWSFTFDSSVSVFMLTV